MQKRYTGLTRAAVALGLFALFAPWQASAQGGDQGLDEIVVRGERSLRQLRLEAGRATENFYRLLNEVLDDDDFRVTCRTERPTGSRISRRVCRTAFQEEQLRRQGTQTLAAFDLDEDDNMLLTGPLYDPSPALLQMQREFADAIMEAVNSDPELNRATRELIALKEAVDRAEGRAD